MSEEKYTEEDLKSKLQELATEKTEKVAEAPKASRSFLDKWCVVENYFAPVLFTALSFFVRMYKIGVNNHVVWDEAHFGKFGSYYLRHEFYHDVHPPLGKMLVGFSGYLAGYNGSWDFPSGQEYPDYIDYVKMRLFNATFGALCVPIAYFTMKEIGFNRKITWLFTLMVCLELSYTTLARFILLDSMLLFFTVATVFCFSRFHNQNRKPGNSFKRKWWKWLLLTGICIGCTTSVKMVGLFVTTLVGIYTVVDLWLKLGKVGKSMSLMRYAAHWISRGVGLIIIPLIVFLICFKLHFDLLYGSGPGDATMSSLFQANLNGSTVGVSPRDLMTRDSVFTLKSQGLTGGLLHSHVQTYPEGSKQQQVTTYTHKDVNNDWTFELVREDPRNAFNESHYIVDGMAVRFVHKMTQRNLHTHEVKAAVSTGFYEVSGYGNATIGDAKDNWIVEIVDQFGDEDKLRLHPLSTSVRFKNQVLGCYLASTGVSYPQWGFRQGEVVCMPNPFRRDKRTWWNIENHVNENLPLPGPEFKLPKTNFLKDFIQLNIAMMATNNALVPDSEKNDDLASDAWEWPTLHVGIRLCGWADDTVKYFLIGSPATTWPSTVTVFVFIASILYYIVRWQRQIVDFPEEVEQIVEVEQDEKNTETEFVPAVVETDENIYKNESFNLFLMGGLYPLLGWGLHFAPFIIMARVTYVHHYLPALYFAMMIYCYIVHIIDQKVNNRIFSAIMFTVLYASVIGCFVYFSPFTFGMDQPAVFYQHLRLLKSWRVYDQI